MYVCVGERERERESTAYMGKEIAYMELMTLVCGPSLLSRFVPTCSYGLLCLFRHYVGKICSICSNAIGCHVSFDLCLGFVHYHMFLFCGQFSPYALKSSSLRSLEH